MSNRAEVVDLPFIVPEDVLVVAATELGSRARSELRCANTDYLVSRPGYRTNTVLIDGQTAELLNEFRQPATIVEAIDRFSARGGHAPERVLEEAFMALQRLSATMILVPDGSPYTEAVAASFCEGQLVAKRFEIQRLIRVLQDTEIYLARDRDGASVALKLARRDALGDVRTALAREVDILRHLAGVGAPKLIEHGEVDGRPYIALQWLAAQPVRVQARMLRTGTPPRWREKLHELCVRVVEAYARLHERDVLHGDVHGDNVMVDRDGQVWLLDFGLARRAGAGWPSDHDERSGLVSFMEPALARCQLTAERAPALQALDEQYSVAALVHQLICGAPHVPFAAERSILLKRIVEGRRAPFSSNGFEPWHAVEAALSTALAVDPQGRYADVRAFGVSLAQAQPPRAVGRSGRDALAPLRVCAEVMLERVRGASIDDIVQRPPKASLQYGGAGLAWLLYRAALLRDDPALLADADLWSRAALQAAGQAGGLDCAEVGVTEERISGLSLYHRAPGLQLVRALIAQARGDRRVFNEAAGEFLAATAELDAPLELAFGHSGVLVGGALLLEATMSEALPSVAPLQTMLRARAELIDARCAEAGPADPRPATAHLGMAHGWSGILYARLLAAQALTGEVPPWVDRGLDALAKAAEPSGRGLCWQGTPRTPVAGEQTPQRAPGWCAGTAGHVHLWTLAHELLGEQRWLDCARGAAWHCWEHPDRSGHLCCGVAGRALALARLYQHAGSEQWVRRARTLLSQCHDWLDAQADTARPLSLLWGQPGLLLAVLELAEPMFATMPAFGRARWPRT